VIKHKLLRHFAALLLLLLMPVSAAAAAPTGSLLIQEIEHPVCLYRVADADGSLSREFEDYALSYPFSDPVKAARELQAYAASHRITGWTAVPENGEASFPQLAEGVYLVCSLRDKGEFAPFLLSIPTRLNGKTVYHIQAKPKQEDPPPETEATRPTETPSDSVIPQTGNSVVPRYALMILGSAVTLAGLYEVICGREEQPDE